MNNGSGFNLCSRKPKQHVDGLHKNIASCSMAWCGGCGQVHPGETCRNGMASGPPFTVAFNVGASQASGTGCWPSYRLPWMWRATWIGRSTSLTPPPCGLISMLLGQKKQSGARGPRAFSGWFQHQNPCPL